VSKGEHLEDLDRPRPVRLRDPQADDDGVTQVDKLERLEPASLLVEICEAADDLPTVASGGRLFEVVGRLDATPHDLGIQQGDPGRQLSPPEALIGIPDHRFASNHHPGSGHARAAFSAGSAKR